MKKIVILFFFLSFIIPGITSAQDTTKVTGDTLKIQADTLSQGDSVTYELLIFDTGFDSWFHSVRKPEWYYEQSYLETWNQQLVAEWNSLYSAGSVRNDCYPETYLDYDNTIDYGKKLNYKLYYYFRYMQERCHLFSHAPSSW
jgi:hypothetical protein